MLPVDRTSVIVRLMSGIFIAALLGACAAPPVAPVAPAATPVPPTPTPGPLEIAQAYESAWNQFDADAVGALFAEPFSANYGGYEMTDLAAWSQGWPYGMAKGLGMRIRLHDCQVAGDTITCGVLSDTDCFDMEVTEALTVKDGKITRLVHQESAEENSQFDAYMAAVEKWAAEQGVEELPTYRDEVAKGEYGYEWGAAFAALCKQYEVAQAQTGDPTAVVQAWIDAINSGDLDVALALMTPDSKMSGVFTDPPPDVLDWFINGTFRYGVPDCQPQGDQLACTFPFRDDGCIAAHGADDLTVKMDFAFQDGKIHRVTVMEGTGNWAGYNGWLGEMLAWASANHADELAQVDFQHQTKGADIVVKLCQEYAETLK